MPRSQAIAVVVILMYGGENDDYLGWRGFKNPFQGMMTPKNESDPNGLMRKIQVTYLWTSKIVCVATRELVRRKKSPCIDHIFFHITAGDCEETTVDLSIYFS